MKASPYINTDRLLIILVIAIGAVLRFYNYGDIPFTHDEFSALFRTQFSSFSDLILKGVIVDTHPAGVQVFMYYWVKLAGMSEPMVKLPFTLFSLAAVYLTYLIGRKWFSPAAGLIAASFMSFLQYPLMYGQIARPYASGSFLVLLLVYFWTNLMLSPNRRYYANLAGYIIASALCAYNHHFTLLFCGIAGLTGLLLIDGKKRLSFVLSWLAIFLLYLPHVSIFFSQLRQGGIGGWLSPPRPDFVIDYVCYAFQFSWYVFAAIILVALLGIAWRTKGQHADFRLVLVSFFWFVIPLLTGFLYSVMVNPVLQYSVLIYSFPFLLLLMFFYAGAVKEWQKIILVAICALAVIPSLISERKHYSLFYHSPYKSIISRSRHVADSLGRANCFVMIDSYKPISSYYLEKPGMQDFHPDCVHDFAEIPQLGIILDSCRSRYFIYGCISNSSWTDYSQIVSKYPYVLVHDRFNEGDFYVFSRDSLNTIREYYFESETDYITNKSNWDNMWAARVWYSGGALQTPVFWMDSSVQFGPLLSIPLRDICRHKNDIIDVTADVETGEGFDQAFLQIGLYSGKELLSLHSETILKGKPSEFRRYYCSLRLADIEWRHHSLRAVTFIWNPRRQDLMIKCMSLRVRHGNPVLYGLYRKIE